MAKNFRDIKVWQKAHKLVLRIYKITTNFPLEEKYGLVNQLRRAAISIASNIVEGFKRKSLRDRLHFYNVSNSSVEEVKYQLLLAKDLNYIDKELYIKVIKLAEEVSKMLNSWIKKQR